MSLFKLPLPTRISTGSGSGSGDSIVSNDSSVIVQTNSSGQSSVVLTTENQTALTVTPSQNTILGDPNASSIPNSRLVILPASNGNCISIVRDANTTSTISLDSEGDLQINTNGQTLSIANSDLDIVNHNSISSGLRLNGSLVISTAVQLNYNSVVPGSGTAMRSMVLDANKSISNITKITATELSGTLLTASQPNITTLNDINITSKLKLRGTEITATADQLNSLNSIAGQASASRYMLLDANRNITNVGTLSASNIYGIVGTSSQPSITSLGYLTSLSIEGDFGLGTQSPTAKLEIYRATTPAVLRLNTGGMKSDIYTDTSGYLNLVPAGSTVLFGTNKSLIVGGSSSSLECASITASRLTGLIQTASQPNITDVGVLNNLSVSSQILVGVSTSNRRVEIRDEQGGCIRLSRAASQFCDLLVTTSSDLVISTSGNILTGSETSIRMSNGDVTGVRSLIAQNVSGTLQTAAQPNVTSLGILSSLNVTNTVSANAIAASILTGTLQTAAQPNVTSLGTLSSLNVTNTITTNSLLASTLTGTLQTPTQPNITSLGTLSSLNVTNTVTATSVIASSISGAIQTAVQTNITALGTLSSLNVTSSVTAGSIVSSSLTGTLQTPIQSNITSVGTLSSLTVAGSIVCSSAIEGLTLKGTLLTSAQPNITSIGTLSSLIVTGTISSQTLTTTTVSGTILTAAQPNITSLGHLSRITTSGSLGIGTTDPSTPFEIHTSTESAIKISRDSRSAELFITDAGDLTLGCTNTNRVLLSPGTSLVFTGSGGISGLSAIAASTVTGTLTTTVQPNIQSVGTLSSLDVNGSVRIGTEYSSSYKCIISSTSGNCIQMYGNNGGSSSMRVLNGELYLAPSGQSVRLSQGTNLVLDGGTIVGFTGFDVTNLETTITKADQPNITSLGTLSSLQVNGNTILTQSTGNAIVVNGRSYLNGDVSISGVTTMINTAVCQSGLNTSSIISDSQISIGNSCTIGGDLNIDGQIYLNGELLDLGSMGADSASIGTVQADRLFIVDNSLNLEGFNNLSASSLYGTIRTQAQPQITSVGTLSALNVSGYLGVGITNPEYQLESKSQSNGKCLKLSCGDISVKFDCNQETQLSSISTDYKLDISASESTINKIAIGNTSNRVLPIEVGYTSFNFNSAYAYNNSSNGHGTLAAGSTFVYNYSIRALGRILCTQSVDVTSDRRAKRDITNLDSEFCERFVMTTTPVKFKWRNGDSQVSYGYIAQDLLSNDFGELVGVDPDESMEYEKDSSGVISPKGVKFNVSYNYVIPILAQNQKRLIRENRELRARLSNLEKLVEAILKSSEH